MSEMHPCRKRLRSLAKPSKVPEYQRFFKTGKGEYGEGDLFLGIKVPDIRNVVREYHRELNLSDLEEIVSSPYHEERMFALLVLVYKYKSRSNSKESKKSIFDFYLKHMNFINNWDLVDVTAPHIIGMHLLDKDRKVLYRLAKSKNLWEKRISIISTFPFINSHEFDDSLNISDILLKDEHDLIHKAVGWTLRNIGIKNLQTEIEYLKPRYKTMPRTLLRYAIEKFEPSLRKKYLLGEI
ncbi:MAG: DNA alkylation repair protein [Leptospiraceae bacterium]|nr:DNA alkylation repair protein [Leptospiraceae bacterium]MCP5511437.1 DNA alkylation repair protein [Leptospiraceae bacterium]